MAGEDLLHQGGTGTGQAQHEYGGAVGATFPGLLLQQRLVKHFNDGVVEGLRLHRVVLRQHALFAVAPCVITPGLVVILSVIVGFAQGEQKIHLRLLGQSLRVIDAGRHLGDLLVAEAVGFQIGQAPVDLAVVGSDPNAVPVGFDGLVLLAYGLEGVSQP